MCIRDRVVGQPELQQAIRWNLWQLAQATIGADSDGVPAKGLTADGYDGQYFWDSEMYVAPFLAYTNPVAAKNLIRLRYDMLDSAYARAEELGHPGALFPWRTINGEEASAYYPAGTAQYHLGTAIAYAIGAIHSATADMASAAARHCSGSSLRRPTNRSSSAIAPSLSASS